MFWTLSDCLLHPDVGKLEYLLYCYIVIVRHDCLYVKLGNGEIAELIAQNNEGLQFWTKPEDTGTDLKIIRTNPKC